MGDPLQQDGDILGERGIRECGISLLSHHKQTPLPPFEGGEGFFTRRRRGGQKIC
jgi:hypothetical protein